MASELTHYRVYLAAYLGNPEHHAIYVNSGTNCRPNFGYIFHVAGSLQLGMNFETKRCIHPFRSHAGESMRQVGWVSQEDFLKRIEDVCLGITPPKKQFHGPRRLFPQEPVRHCQHWAAEAIDALLSSGVLEPLRPNDNGDTIRRFVEEQGMPMG